MILNQPVAAATQSPNASRLCDSKQSSEGIEKWAAFLSRQLKPRLKMRSVRREEKSSRDESADGRRMRGVDKS